MLHEKHEEFLNVKPGVTFVYRQALES